jgi:hypothetical protein
MPGRRVPARPRTDAGAGRASLVEARLREARATYSRPQYQHVSASGFSAVVWQCGQRGFIAHPP